MSEDRNVAVERFMRDVKNHQMVVIHESGVHRHLRFKRQGTMCMHFDIITWPGYLCYTGDMGTYVFTRLNDMLEFFRGGTQGDLFRSINRQYWAEKVEAQDKWDGIREFSEKKFNRAVVERLVDWIRENRNLTTREERRELWDAVVDEVIRSEGDGGGHRKQAAANDFTHHVNKEAGSFWFSDFYESNVEEWTARFNWCCFALRWAVNFYDTEKATAPTEVAA